MTSISSAVFRHFLLALAFVAAGYVFLSHSKFETDRAFVIQQLKLPQADFLLYIVGAVVLLVCLGIAARLSSVLSTPLQTLIKQAETKKLTPGVSQKSQIAEAAHLYFILEAQARNVKEMEDQVDELDSELKRLRDPSDESEKPAAPAQAPASADDSQQLAALRSEIDALAQKNASLKEALDAESKRPLSTEAAAQLKEAMDAAAFKSTWIAKLAAEIESHCGQINRVATRLKNTWLDTPLSRIRDDVEELARLSDAQAAALRGLSDSPSSPAAAVAAPLKRKAFPLASSLLDLLDSISFPDVKLEPNIALPDDYQTDADKDLLLQTLKSLISTAAHRIQSGEVELRCRLELGHPAYRISSVGEHRPDAALDLGEANRIAPSLGCEVETERKSESVVFLHLRPQS